MLKKILWIDDTPHQVREIVDFLRDEGYEVVLTASASEGASSLAGAPDQYLAVVVDLLMSGGTIMVPGAQGPELLDTMRGLQAGKVFGRWAKKNWPDLNIIGVSIKADLRDPQVDWFRKTCEGYFDKYTLFISPRPLLLLLNSLAKTIRPTTSLNTYLLAGQPDPLKNNLLHYLKTRHRLPAPLLIEEHPLREKSLLEKLLGASDAFKLIFVLLTESDLPGEETAYWQKQIQMKTAMLFFDAGLLAAACQDNRGKIIFLHRGGWDLPASMPNSVLFDISNGIEAADEKISREISAYLPLLRRG